MINRLYNPWHITNSGEKEADKQLSVQGRHDELDVCHVSAQVVIKVSPHADGR